MTKIRVDTSEFVSSHMRAPRGRGGWMFLFDREEDIMKCFSHDGTYAEARRAAVARARARGHVVVRVMP